MTRQATDSLYIDLEYFTPEEYYVYIAEAIATSSSSASLACDAELIEGGGIQEAEAALTSTATVTALVGVVKQATASVVAEFTVFAAISHIEGADLFAFSEAALALEVARLRNYSASLDSIFDIATDYIRVKQLSADAACEFTQTSEGVCSRDFDSQIEATVSLECVAENIKGFSAELTVNSTASILLATLFEASLVTEFICSANAIEYIKKVPPFGRPINLQFVTGNIFNSNIKQFGTHSLGVPYLQRQSTDLSNSFAAVDGEDFILESWVYVGNTDIIAEHGINFISYGDFERDIENYSNNGSFALGWTRRELINTALQPRKFVGKITTNTGSIVTITGHNSAPPFVTWFHIALKRTNGVLSIWYNNVQRGTANYTGAIRLPPISNNRRLFLQHNYSISTDRIVYFDSVRFARGDSTIRGYTNYPPNDFDTTVALYKMDNSLLDDVSGFSLSTSANLVANASLNVILGKTSDAISLQASSGTLTVEANVVKGAESNQSSEFEFTVEGEFVAQEFEVAAQVTADLTTTADVVRSASSNLEASSEQLTTATRIFDFNIETDSVATLLSAVAKTGNTLVTVEVFANLTADSVKTTDINVDLTTDTVVSANGEKSVDYEAALSCEIGIAVAGDRIRFADTSLEVQILQDTTAIKTATGESSQSSEFNFVASPRGLIGFDVALESAVNVQADIQIFRDFDTSINTESTLTVNAIKAVETSVALDAETIQSIEYIRYRDVETNFESIASNISVVNKIGDYLVDMASTFALDIDAVVNASGSIALESTISQTASAERTRDNDSNMLSTVDIVANARTTTDAALDADITTTQTTVAQKIVDAIIAISDAATFTSTVVATRNNELQISVNTELAATGNVIRNAFSNNVINTNVVASATRRRNTASSAAAQFTMVSDGRIILIDKFEYVIPKEFREFAIHREARQYRIVRETREHIVRG